MLQRADMAMYSAKRRRTGVAVYRPEHDLTSLRQHALTGDLRRAIERGELDLHYQPKLAARDRQAWSAWRRWRAGDTPNSASSPPTSSSVLPKRPVRSCR